MDVTVAAFCKLSEGFGLTAQFFPPAVHFTVKPAVKVTIDGKALVKDSDFTVKYSSNKKVGTATVTIKGKGAFTGTAKAHFKVKKAKASKFKVATIAARTYTGKLVQPRPKVTFKGKKLKLGRDYKLSYKSNRNVGVAKVVIQGKGNFTGKKTVAFRIKKPAAEKKQASSASSSSSGTVYWVPNGEVYHLSRSCRSLARSSTILSGTIQESGKPRACKNCS